jgi:hypothetical protein
MSRDGDSKLSTQEDIEAAITESRQWFRSRYITLSNGYFPAAANKEYLGEIAPRVCRYCGLSSLETTFRKESHAFPHMTGNRALFDRFECDACNKNFANNLEDHFGKWTHPWRAFGLIVGKNGIPSYLSMDKKFRTDASRDELHIQHFSGDVRVIHDELSRLITFKIDRSPYIPIAVFKCFVKMAMAVMPNQEAERCAHLKEWILSCDHATTKFPVVSLNIIHTQIPGYLRGDQILFRLMRRRREYENECPYMQFLFYMGNNLFQIVLPMPVENDSSGGQDRGFTKVWPLRARPYSQDGASGDYYYSLYDMSSSLLASGDCECFRVRYSERKLIKRSE